MFSWQSGGSSYLDRIQDCTVGVDRLLPKVITFGETSLVEVKEKHTQVISHHKRFTCNQVPSPASEKLHLQPGPFTYTVHILSLDLLFKKIAQ